MINKILHRCNLPVQARSISIIQRTDSDYATI